MTEAVKKNDAERKPRFQEYDCVVLKKNIKGTDLKKGDRGAIVDVWDSGLRVGIPTSYEVEFVEKSITKGIPEKYLKADDLLWWKSRKTAESKNSFQAPSIPEHSSQSLEEPRPSKGPVSPKT